MKLSKYQEYQLKFAEKASKLTTGKYKRAYRSLPRMYSENEFYREYQERKIMYSIGYEKNTNYLRDIISDQFKTSESYTNAILKNQENKIYKIQRAEIELKSVSNSSIASAKLYLELFACALAIDFACSIANAY